jgi:type IX secretion system PorP/SprF family membrane protein
MLNKKLLIATGLIAFTSVMQAQQKPQYTQYVLNNYILNPAFSGIENYTEAKISHRHQWVGLDGAPVTSYFTLHTPIGKVDDRLTPTSMEKGGVNIRGNDYVNSYGAASPHHGVGVQIVNDVTGPLQNFSATATYAYHLAINDNTNISAGFGVGINRLSLNANKLFFGTSNPIDPSVSGSGAIGKVNFDVNAGVLVYNDRFYAGLSALNVVPQKVEFANNALRQVTGKRVPHLFATAGTKMFLNEDFSLIPSVMLKYAQPTPLQAEVNAKVQYLDLLWAGASYRFKYGFAGMLGINATRNINIGYSYDYTTTRLNTVSNGTHEIVVGFIFGNKFADDNCPRRTW